MNLIKNIFRTRGRIDRLIFFIYFVITDILGGLVILINNSIDQISIFTGLLLIVIYIILMWIWICATIKRFHDLNKNGDNIFLLLIPLYNLYIMAILFFKKGTYGVNKYGDDPIGDNNFESNIQEYTSREAVVTKNKISLDSVEKFMLRFLVICLILGFIFSLIWKMQGKI